MACPHTTSELVIPIGTDQAVAELCSQCLERLPLGWSCPNCERHTIRLLNGDAIPSLNPCDEHW